MALAPDLPDVHYAMASYCRRVARDFAQSHPEFMRGLETPPDNALLLRGAALTEQYLGLWEEAAIHLRRSQDLDPRTTGGLGFSCSRSSSGYSWPPAVQYGRGPKGIPRRSSMRPTRRAAWEEGSQSTTVDGGFSQQLG